MRMRWWALACLGGLMLARLAGAEERHLEFLNGLREQRLHDYALLFIDQLEARPNLDPAIKEILPYERALTLLEGAELQETPDLKLRQLDLATQFLQQFVKASPQHPRAVEANSQLAEVLVRKGMVELLQGNNPGNSAKKGEFMARARAYFGEARKMYQAAYDGYTALLKSLPPGFIEQKDPRHKQREEALVAQIMAEYHLNMCTYHEAQTFDKTDPKRKELLLKAADDFEKVHQRHRSVVAGLYARMQQGKCFEEMGDITKALGIYNELLGHGAEAATEPVLKRLQDNVLRFKLICLNDESKNDNQVVVQLATDWLTANRDKTLRSVAGVGIRWERARAYEQLAIRAKTQGPKSKSVEKPAKTPKKTKGNEKEAVEEEVSIGESELGNWETLYRQAETDAKYVNNFPGEFRAASKAMLDRISNALNKEQGDPKSFDQAFAAAKDLVGPIKAKRDALAKATGAEKDQLTKAYADHIAETIRICKLTLALNGPVSAERKKDREKELNKIRYYLSYAHYSHPSRQYAYDSALIGEYLARKVPDDPAQSLDAGYLAMNAWNQAYLTSEAAKRAQADPIKSVAESRQNFDIQRMIGIANFLTEKFPTHDKAQDARITLGTLYLQTRQPAEAAKVFLQVPPEAKAQYLDARLKAGIALWDAAASNPALPKELQISEEEVKKYPAEARKILEEAIAQQEKDQPADAAPGDAVTAAKLSLVQILNGSGEYPAAIKHITEGPKSVLVGASRIDGKRGDTIKVATRVELLRAYVGAKQVDKAREQLKELEKLGGTEGLTGILVTLGKELKKEIERLERAKDPRLAEVLQSFEAFLGDLASRKDGQDFGSLMWVGQTYLSLAEGVEKSDAAKAAGYFSKAGDAYQGILDRAKTDPKFIPDRAEPGVRLRLITARRREKKFDDAYKLMVELLKTNANALDIQTEAAQIYSDRAAQGGPEDWKYWEKAIAGDLPKARGIEQTYWGWFLLAEKLRASKNQQNLSATQKADYEFRYFEARYNVAYARLQFARNQPKDADKEQNLTYAKTDIVNTASQVESFGDRADYAKFNALYREVQEERNSLLRKLQREKEIEAVADLEKNSFKPEAPKPFVARKAKKKKTATAAAPAQAPKKPESSGGGMVLFAVIGVVALLAIGGVVLMMRKPKKRSLLAEEPVALPKAAPKKPARTKA